MTALLLAIFHPSLLDICRLQKLKTSSAITPSDDFSPPLISYGNLSGQSLAIPCYERYQRVGLTILAKQPVQRATEYVVRKGEKAFSPYLGMKNGCIRVD